MKRKLKSNETFIFEIHFNNGEVFTLEESEFKSLEEQKTDDWAYIYKDGKPRNDLIIKVNKNQICYIKQRVECNMSMSVSIE